MKRSSEKSLGECGRNSRLAAGRSGSDVRYANHWGMQRNSAARQHRPRQPDAPELCQ
jgi:hypothetical protein